MNAKLIVPLVTFLLSLPATACECLWEGSFADIAPKVDYIVHGRIVQTKGNSVDLEVQQELKGTGHFDTVRIWLKTQDLCRAELDRFALEEQWVFALDRINEVPDDGFNPMTPNISYGRVGDFSLGGCGGYFLPSDGRWIAGPIINATKWDFEPDTTPVLLELIESYVQGQASRSDLQEATQMDPALRELMINTRLHVKP